MSDDTPENLLKTAYDRELQRLSEKLKVKIMSGGAEREYSDAYVVPKESMGGVVSMPKAKEPPTTSVFPPKAFTTKTGGERKEFESGMVRDVDDSKTDFDLVFNGPMLDRWAALLTRGAVHYPDMPDGTPNWMQANGQDELNRFRKSACRHFRQWRKGDVDEDHAAAVMFNLNGYEYVKALLEKQGLKVPGLQL